jgi:long-subunit acyl-CoA synthetase (AMP-forming)
MASDCPVSGLAHLAEVRGESVAYIEEDGASISYFDLHRTVMAAATAYRSLPETVGILAPNGIGWVTAYLALMRAGKTIVPMPGFFSDRQLGHVIADAAIEHILATPATFSRAEDCNIPFSDISAHEVATVRPPKETIDATGGKRLVIYTSGSTGKPKGVCLGDSQLAYCTTALIDAIGVNREDSYLSCLPLSLLLEQVCAIHIPLRKGVPVVLGTAMSGPDLALLAEETRPTLMVLVPQLLGAWAAALRNSKAKAPDSLRFVAVGGAPVAESVARDAWNSGIPVHEGYGLSECCSVVSLNRPGSRASGTVGYPVDGVSVDLDADEIVVRGPTVMDGYLGNPETRPDGVWRTGDIGKFDPEGRLVVLGRKDSMLVTPAGRNVVPEWIEALVAADPRLNCIVLFDAGTSGLGMLLVPHAPFEAEFQSMIPDALHRHLAGLLSSAPEYARPSLCVVLTQAEMVRRNLLNGVGLPVRAAVAKAFPSPAGNPTEALFHPSPGVQ